MTAVIIDDGTLDTVVEYEGKQIRYDSEYRRSYDSDEDFLDAAFKDFYDDQTNEPDAIHESLPPDITLCYNDDCRCWKTTDEHLEGYAVIECLRGCRDYKVLYKELPKITDEMWVRLQYEPSSE